MVPGELSSSMDRAQCRSGSMSSCSVPGRYDIGPRRSGSEVLHGLAGCCRCGDILTRKGILRYLASVEFVEEALCRSCCAGHYGRSLLIFPRYKRERLQLPIARRLRYAVDGIGAHRLTAPALGVLSHCMLLVAARYVCIQGHSRLRPGA